MDGSTDRCPQCGAAIRPSARYCVTCGVKLPDAVASAYPAAASGWAAREERSQTADSNPASTSVWAMPAAHPDEARPDDVDAAESAPTFASTVSDDADLSEAVEEVSQPASEQVSDTVANEPETAPLIETPITSDDQEEREPVDERSEPVNELLPGEPEIAVLETDTEIAEDADAMTGDLPESTVPEPEIEATVIEENAEPIAANDAADSDLVEAIATEEDLTTPDSTLEQLINANPSPLEEAAFEEMLPYAAEAGSEWEPTAEPDEIFALDEIEFDDSNNFEAETLVVAEDASTAGDIATVANGDEAMQRANQLIDELRDLLPALTSPLPAVQSPDYSSLREQALAARGDVSFDQFAALREVVQEALSRPRDVEVVLRLSRRVEDMNALLGERDRLQQAFEQLIAQLDANGAS